MQILSATDGDGKQLDLDQMLADLPELKQKHEKAQQEDLNWSMFGGVLYINSHRYQVM